ncbi:Hsp20 family protein [Noviherbaspirillum massiliense]|uniref:Hsp20 family protein n=1 Tax=Noviherbaspirillum massiliense TaxID=1465823 RepID=UPI00030A716E|nr:Hsp20 family protein [Noviherbaspirillum massiliense]
MDRVEQSIEVNVPLHTVYGQLTQFEQYPRFLQDVREVRQLDDTHLHWHAGLGNREREWDAEIIEQVPDRRIAWRTTSGPKASGAIELQAVDGEKTRIVLTLECDALPEVSATTPNPVQAFARRIEEDLARFKKFIENLGQATGEWSGEVRHGQVVGSGQGQASQMAGEAMGKAVGRGSAEQQEAGVDAMPRPDMHEGRTQERQARTENGGRSSGKPGLFPSRFPNLLQGWEEPLAAMRRMSEEMDQFFEKTVGRPMMGSRWRQAATNAAWTPAVEVARREDKVVVCAELPGVKREEVQVEIHNDRLTIEGERLQQPRSEREFRRSERSYGHFYRCITLPDGVDADGASAAMHDGLLEITIPIRNVGGHGRKLDIATPPQ